MLIAIPISFLFILQSIMTATINLDYSGVRRKVCRVEVAERTLPVGIDIRKQLVNNWKWPELNFMN